MIFIIIWLTGKNICSLPERTHAMYALATIKKKDIAASAAKHLCLQRTFSHLCMVTGSELVVPS